MPSSQPTTSEFVYKGGIAGGATIIEDVYPNKQLVLWRGCAKGESFDLGDHDTNCALLTGKMAGDEDALEEAFPTTGPSEGYIRHDRTVEG
jgi:hypothetical protein